MIGVLGHQDMGQQARAGQAPGNWPADGRGLDHRVATPAGQLGPDMADHLETGRDIVEDFRDIFTQRLQVTATIRAARRFGFVHHGFPRQMVGERFANRLTTRFLRRHRCRGDGAFSLGSFEFLKGEFELPEHLVDLLGSLTELQAPELGDDQFEMFDFGIPLGEQALLRQNHRLQGIGVSGQACGTVHAKSLRASLCCEQPCLQRFTIIHPARSGCQLRLGRRQSMPSRSMESWAALR